MNYELSDKQKIWEILHSYEAEIFGYIKHAVGSIDIARDLYQDVYLQALQNIDQLDPDRSLKNWLMTVTRNRVINYFRERKRRNFVSISDEISQGQIQTKNGFENAIEYALQNMPKSQKEIFILRELDGLNYKELSESLGLSISGVTSLLDRARKNFSKFFILYLMPDWFKKNARDLSLKDLARFADSFESTENLLIRIHKKSQNYFAKIEKDWDEIRKYFVNVQQLNQIISELGNQKALSVLDLGSGTGFISSHCSLNGAHVISVDLNSQMLKSQAQLRNRLGLKDLKLIRANINHLPFKDSKFDQIFLTLVLHHISDPVQSIKNVASMLKSSGKLVIIDFMRHNNRNFSDQMHDLWMGFEPGKVQKWAKKVSLYQIHISHWQTEKLIEVFCQILTKIK